MIAVDTWRSLKRVIWVGIAALMVVGPGVGLARAESPWYEFRFENETGKTLYLAVMEFEESDCIEGRWQVSGWNKLGPGEFATYTSHRIAYYAKSHDGGRWDGKYENKYRVPVTHEAFDYCWSPYVGPDSIGSDSELVGFGAVDPPSGGNSGKTINLLP